jgi:flagellar protein FliT
MELVQQLLVASEKLHAHLTKLPDDKERDAFILAIDELLDARGKVIEQLQAQTVDPLKGHVLQPQLLELDIGIQERLVKVQRSIKDDMQQLQTTKKSEQRYTNPYAAVRVMDGTYFDGKK